MNLLKKVVPGLCVLALILVFFGKKIIPASGNFICGIDVEYAAFWLNFFSKEEFLSGRLPLWNPYNFTGIPLFPNVIFYPTAILYVLLPLNYAFNLDITLHMLIGAMGVYSLVRLITGSKFAGISAGSVYCFSGYTIARIVAGHMPLIYSTSIMTWIFFFVEKSFRGKRISNLALAGTLLGVQILSGDAQDVYYTALFISVFFFLRSIWEGIATRNYINSFKNSVSFFLIPIISFGIGAVQIIPTSELLTMSLRTENNYSFSTAMSFPFRNFFTFLIPKNIPAFRTDLELMGFIGIFGLMLSALGFVFTPHKQIKYILAIMLVFAVSIMLGYYSPIYRLYFEYIPGFSTFRVPGRCIILVVLILSVFVGLGIQYLNEAKLSKKYFFALICISFTLMMSLFSGAKTYGVSFYSKQFLLAAGSLSISVVFLFFFNFLSKMKIAPVITIIILFLESHLIFSGMPPVKNMSDLLKEGNVERVMKRSQSFERIILPFYFLTDLTDQAGPSVGGLRTLGFRYSDLNGYAAVMIKDYYTFIQVMAGLNVFPDEPIETHFLGLGIFDPEKVFSTRILNLKYAVANTPQGWKLIQADEVFPRALIVHNAIFAPDKYAHLPYLKNSKFNPKEHILLLSSDRQEIESYITTPPQKGIEESRVEIFNYLPNRIELSSVSYQDGYLLLSEIFYPGWQAYVDGKKVPVFRADFLLRAIPLKAGHHDIVFVYRPMSFLWGAALSVSTVILLIVCFLFFNIRSANRNAVLSSQDVGVLRRERSY